MAVSAEHRGISQIFCENRTQSQPCQIGVGEPPIVPESHVILTPFEVLEPKDEWVTSHATIVFRRKVLRDVTGAEA